MRFAQHLLSVEFSKREHCRWVSVGSSVLSLFLSVFGFSESRNKALISAKSPECTQNQASMTSNSSMSSTLSKKWHKRQTKPLTNCFCETVCICSLDRQTLTAQINRYVTGPGEKMPFVSWTWRQLNALWTYSCLKIFEWISIGFILTVIWTIVSHPDFSIEASFQRYFSLQIF